MIGSVLVRRGGSDKAGRRCVVAELDSYGYYRVFYPATAKRRSAWGRYSPEKLEAQFCVAKKQEVIDVPISRYSNVQHRRRTRDLVLNLIIDGELRLTKRYAL